MRDIWTIAVYSMLRMIRHRSVFVFSFAMPILVIFILGSALSAYFVSKPVQSESVRLAWLVEDQGFIRTSLEGLLSSGGLGDVRKLEVRSKQELKGVLDRGEADAALYVPAGFSDSLRQGGKPTWSLATGSNPIKSAMSIEVLHAFFDEWNLRLAETGSWQGGADPLDGPVRLGERASGETEYLRVSRGESMYLSLSALQYYSAHMLVMFMLYFGMASAIFLTGMKEDRTLMRMRSLPVPVWRILAGNVLGQSMILVLQTGFIIGGTSLLFGVDWGGKPWETAWICFLVLLFTQSLAVIMGIVAKRRREVTLLFQALIVVMTFLAGGFTPSIGESLSRLGSFTLNHWAAQGLLRLMLHDSNPGDGALTVLAGWAAGAVLTAIAVYWKAGYHE